MKSFFIEHRINYLGEFQEKNLEIEFFQHEMQKALVFLKPTILMLGILNTMFLIPDFFLISNKNNFIIIALSRIIFIILVLGLYFGLKFLKNYRVMSNIVTCYEIMGSWLFLFIFLHYQNPNYLIQSFGVMIIILVIFMVPNRWLNMIIVSILIEMGFNVISVFYIKDLKFSEISAVVVYLGIEIILCSMMSYRNNFYKRVHYVKNKELLRLSSTDHLTGIYNRAKLNDELKRNIILSKRYYNPLTIIIFDFDEFKTINDTFGHLCGDSVIIESVNLIQNIIRETDIFARWGGEEFVILLPNTDKDDALNLAERLRKGIEGHPFKGAGSVTCSFGVVKLSSEDDINSFLKKADQMLYKAKHSGRNIVKS